LRRPKSKSQRAGITKAREYEKTVRELVVSFISRYAQAAALH
jgi:hypothetical protein